MKYGGNAELERQSKGPGRSFKCGQFPERMFLRSRERGEIARVVRMKSSASLKLALCAPGEKQREREREKE